MRRVFAVAPDCHVAGWRYGTVWRNHFYGGLQGTGAEVVLPSGLDWGWARPPQAHRAEEAAPAREATSAALLGQIQESARHGLDAVISYCFTHDLELDVVDRVRSAGIPWINFFCDSLYAFHTVEGLARRTDLNWFVEAGAEASYRELGVRALRAPYALNPALLPDAACRDPKRALAFVGSAHRNRTWLALRLRLAGVDLHVTGSGWPLLVERDRVPTGGLRRPLREVRRVVAARLLEGRYGGHLEGEALLEYLRTSRVLLGLNEAGAHGTASVRYLKLRDIELPGMACAYVTQRNDDVELAFDVGPEIRTFASLAELKEILRELDRAPAECVRMGQAARRRVLAEHTWSARLPQLLQALR